LCNGKQVVYRLPAHVVLATKYRSKVTPTGHLPIFARHLVGGCGRFGVCRDVFENDGDPAHLLVTYPQKVSLSRLVMPRKTISSMG